MVATETRPIIALDFPDFETVKDFLGLFGDESLYVKVGMELFYSVGPEIVNFVKSRGHSVFLDLKLHDIPHTVSAAMRVLARLGVDMVNVHAAGGAAMMTAAREGLLAGTPAGREPAKLLAVTQLTSTTQEAMQREQRVSVDLQESVIHYAKLSDHSGLDGVVCSAQEVVLIKYTTRSDFLCLTPGIRPAGSAVGDQRRVMTPAEARKAGSGYIVVGRPITQAANPLTAYRQIKKEWNSV